MESIYELTTGIEKILNSEFKNTGVYTENIKQGFMKPCFFIKILSSTQNKEGGKRYKRSISFDISYFSEISLDLNNVIDKLYEVLQYIKINDKVYRSSKMMHEFVDDVLHFKLSVNYHVVKETVDINKMEKLKVEVKASGR